MRITSLSPATTEILFRLGKGDLIVCTDQFSNFPEAAKALPHVRDHQKVHPEDLKDFSPDIVFTSTVVQAKLAEELKKQFTVIHQDPRTINDVYESIRQIGLLLQCDREAQELILSMQQGFNDVKKKAALLPQKLKVYIEEWHQPPFASGNWVPEIARIAGVEQFPVPAGELSKEVTLEQVQQFDPDVIVLSWCGAGNLADKSLLEERERWSVLRAVEQGRVKVIDDSLLNRPGPRLVEGAQRLYGWAFEILH